MTLPPTYFEDLYAESQDPWGFIDRWYERRKRALTLALLPDEHYSSVFEPGCSIGMLTRKLAGRCDALLATDVATRAVQEARDRCADLPHVTVAQATLPADWPDLQFDLVVLSEIGYYFTPHDAGELADRTFGSGATVVAVHWRHAVDDYPLGGDDVHAILDATAARYGCVRCAQYVDDDIRGEVWSTDPRSVAAKAGLA